MGKAVVSLKKRYPGLRLLVPVALVMALGFALLPMAKPVHAASFTATRTGNWSDTTSTGPWGAVAAYPGQNDTSDTVIIDISGGGTVTMDVSPAYAIASLTFNLPNNNKTATLAVGSYTLSTGSISLNGASGGTGQKTQITISTGTINCTGNLSFGGGTPTNGSVVFSSTGNFNIGGDLGTGGTFTSSTSTVNFNGSGAQSIGNYTYYKLATSGSGTKTLAGNTGTVSNTLTVNAGTTLDLSTYNLGATLGPTGLTVYAGGTTASSITGSGTLSLRGNVTVTDSTGGTTGATISCPVALGATRTFTVPDTGAANDLTISGVISGSGYGVTKEGAGTMVLSGLNTYTGAVTINTGILSANTLANASSNSSLGTGSGTAAIAIGASGTLQYTGSGHSTSRAITLTGSGGTIDASGGGTMTLSGGVTGNTYGLVLTGTGNGTESGVIGTTSGTLTKEGTGTWTLSGSNTYTGATNITAGVLKLGATGGGTNTPLGTTAAGTSVTSGAALDLAGYTLGTSEALTLNGTGISSGGALINSSGSAVNYNGAITLGSASSIGTTGNITLGGGITGTQDLTKVGAGTLNLGSSTATLKTLTISAGTLTSTSGTMNLSGDFSNGGTFTHNSGTVNMNGSVAQAIGGASTTAFNSLTISNTSAAVSASTNFSAAGTLTVNSSAILSPAAAVIISGNGTLTGNGTVEVTRTAATADFSSQYTITTKTLTNLTVEYKGGAAQTVSALTYGSLKINNSSGATLGGNTTVNGTLTLTSGKITTSANTLIISSSGTVSGGSSSSYVYGNLQKYVATGSSVSRTFEVGTASYYNPVAVTFANIGTAGNLTIKPTSGQHANAATSRISSTQYVNLYWSFTNSGIVLGDTYSATFTFDAAQIAGSADTSKFIVGKYSGSWSYPTVGSKTGTTTQITGAASFSDFVLGQPPVWESYNEETHETEGGTIAHPYDSANHIAYMYGDGYYNGNSYSVGFYDGNGNKKGSNVSGSLVGTALSALFNLSQDPEAVAGTWHAVAFNSALGSPPETYAACSSTAGYITEDDFEVAVNAIPEFPTVFASIGVMGLCGGIYYRMRKKAGRKAQFSLT